MTGERRGPENGSMNGVPRDRGTTPRVEAKTGSYDAVDFNSPESVEKYLDQIIEQKINVSGREVKPKTRDRWKKYFSKSVDRALRSLQTRATEEEREITDEMQRNIKIEKIGSLKQYVDQALKRINIDLLNKEELKDSFIGIASTLKKDEKIVIVAIDLDNFKIVNDRKGHLVGNEVLESFGGALNDSVDESMLEYVQDAIRPDDITGGHSGGDEFLVLLVMPENASTEEIVKRIIETTQTNTNRPSLATGAQEGEREKQEISTGYDIVRYEDVQNVLGSPQELKQLFDTRLKEADLRSLYSKAEGNGKKASKDRIYGPGKEPEKETNHHLQSYLRILSGKYPEYAANSRNTLVQYAELTLELPSIAKGDPKKFEQSVARLSELMEEMEKSNA